jgi:predicted metal-dependent hydrolase
MQYLLKDSQLGTLRISVNPRARRIIMRATADGLRITVPPGTSRTTLIDTLNEHTEELKAMKQRLVSQKHLIDFNYQIHTDLLQLRLVPSNRAAFYLNRHIGQCEIVCPATTDFAARQSWLHDIIVEQLRIQAKAILPPRLKALAEKHGFQYERVSIQSSQTRWGSCSGRNTINLSLYLMTLPSRLIDYVLLHELCHTVHHDHSPQFWALMDRVTDGQAHTLRNELKGHQTEI